MTRILAIACIASVLGAANCDAALKLKVTDGVSATVEDIDFAGGDVFLTGDVGNFSFNFTAGVGSPVLGGALPNLDLASLNVSGDGGGMLTIELFSTGPDPINDPGPGFDHDGPFRFVAGGTTDGIVSFEAFADGDLMQDYGTAESLGTLGPFGSNSQGIGFTDTKILGPTSETANYSVMIRAVIDHTQLTERAATSFNVAFQAVPEPSAFLYGGVVAAIAGLGYRGRKWMGASVEESAEV